MSSPEKKTPRKIVIKGERAKEKARDIRNCRKSPSQGGFTIGEVREEAKKRGIDPDKLTKDELCRKILQAVSKQEEEQTKQENKNPDEPVEHAPLPEITNEYIADVLDEIGDLERDPRKKTAFKTSSNIVRAAKIPITSHRDAVNALGAGRKSGIEVVDDILDTGKSSRLEDLRKKREAKPKKEKEEDKIVKELKTVFGIGDANAKFFVSQGVKGVEDLRRKVNLGEITVINMVKRGLDYYSDFKEKIPFDEVERVGGCILGLIQDTDPDNIGIIAGSFRRHQREWTLSQMPIPDPARRVVLKFIGTPPSGDIDILMSNTQGRNTSREVIDVLESPLEDLERLPDESDSAFRKREADVTFIKDNFSPDFVIKFQGTYRSGFPGDTGPMRKFDVRYEEYSDWGASIVHATGPWDFNVAIRKVALAQGLSLSEKYLKIVEPDKISEEVARGGKKLGRKLKVPTEEDVFRILGLPFIPPEYRQEWADTAIVSRTGKRD